MPSETAVERRDRALIAFTLLSGARDRAIASLKLKHINIEEGYVDQDAREVRTKFGKSIGTDCFPVGEDIRRIVVDWIRFLREELSWDNESPLFPATRVEPSPLQRFEVTGLDRKHWNTAAPIRTIFRGAFGRAQLPYFNPHSFRNTLVRLGETLCRTPEEFKAWSQNLGHEQVMPTFTSYGVVDRSRQGEIIRGLATPRPTVALAVCEFVDSVFREIRARGVSTA